MPDPVPLLDLLSAIVGNGLVKLQQIPLTVTGAPPSEDISPKHIAELAVILLLAEIVTVGTTFTASFLQ